MIAELFLEGAHIFSLAQLFKYRKGEYTPVLSEIEDKHIQELVTSMTSIDPRDRLSAEEYLEKWKNKLFPAYFYDFLHEFMGALSTRNHFDADRNPLNPQSFLDNRVTFIYDHFNKVVAHVGSGEYQVKLEKETPLKATQDMFPVLLDLPGWKHVVTRTTKHDIDKDDGALIIMSLLVATVRNVSRSSIKLKGCDLMLALCEMINDEAKLDIGLAYFLALLDDESELVQAAAIRNMTQILSLVTVITPVNGGIFSQYIFPDFKFIQHKSELVRATYASCLPSLAQSASRFLELTQILKTTGLLESVDPDTENGSYAAPISYDSRRQTLIMEFQNQANILLTDKSTAVKKAFLKSITPLCIFFGRQLTNDVILTHLITYLNDPDPSLRRQFFDCIIGLGPFIGPTSLEQYILPLMQQALNDPEEYVVSKTFEAFASFAELGVLRKSEVWFILRLSVPYMIHPNSWIRINVLRFLTACVTWMSPAELFCMLHPILRPFLDCDIFDFSQDNLIRSFKSPISRALYNAALLWASKARKSLFWKFPAMKSNRNNSFENDNSIPESFDQVPKSSEDDQWLERLRDMGTSLDDLWKVTILRDHIYRVARLSSRLQSETNFNDMPNEIKLENLDIIPKKVYYDVNQVSPSDENLSGGLNNLGDIREALDRSPNESSGSRPSTSIEAPVQRQSGEIQFGQDGAAVIHPLATTATDTTDVYGLVAQPFLPSSQSKFQFPKGNTHSETYLSADPAVSKFLKANNTESMKMEPSDFGPQVIPVHFAEHIHNPASPIEKPNWKPAGVLAAQFAEHSAAINKIVMSPDHSFFLSCSDDGYIKLWDCRRLEKNVINKSAQTYYCGQTKVKFMCFIENTYTFACSCTDGTVQLIRVDTSLSADSSKPRYRKLTVVRNYKLQDDEYAVWMEHIKTTEGSLLVMATTKSRIAGLDVNSMKEKFVLRPPYSHGIPTCFVIDVKKSWLLLGTSLGVQELWDLRFHLLVKSWTFDDPAPIRRLYLRPKSGGPTVCVLGGTHRAEISIWKLSNMECSEVYHANQHIDHSRIYKATKFEEGPTEHRPISRSQRKRSDSVNENEPELLCMATGADSPKGPDEDNRHVHIISGGSDRKIRFWDLNSVESCSIVSGLAAESEAVSFFRSYSNAVKVIGEKIIYGGGSSKAAPQKGSKSSRASRTARTAIIASEQQDLARNHQASIVDIAILHRPYQMIITGDRAGVIKVFI